MEDSRDDLMKSKSSFSIGTKTHHGLPWNRYNQITGWQHVQREYDYAIVAFSTMLIGAAVYAIVSILDH